MKIVGFPNPSASRYWRFEHPFKYLRRLGHEAIIAPNGITEEIAQWADVYVLHGCIDLEGLALLYAYQQEHGKKIVIEQDDYLYVDEDNPHKQMHELKNAPEIIIRMMEVADMVTTTNMFLANLLHKYNDNVRVLPNYLDLETWEHIPLKNDSGTIRIGWAGSITHLKDLEMIVEPLNKILDEFDCQLILMGEPRAADLFKGKRVEVIPGQDFVSYQNRLGSLRLDIGIAPLRDSLFAHCKSNIKFLEYSINKIPGVYSPTVYGEGYDARSLDGDRMLVAEESENWYLALRNLIAVPDFRKDMGHAAYSYVKHNYNLEKHVKEWVTAYQSLFDRI